MAIQKAYMLVANFPLPLMRLQCRSGIVKASSRLSVEGPPSLIGATGGAATGAALMGYEPPADKAEELARDLERGGCRSSGGVSTNVQALSEEQLAARRAERLPKVRAAQERWKAAAASQQWSLVRIPAECFRFVEDPEAAAATRTSEEYVRKVLDAVGLSDGCEGRGYSHLSPIEIAALRDVVLRKSAAF